MDLVGSVSIGGVQSSLRDSVFFFDLGPSDESLGYFRLSLRDSQTHR